MAEPTPIPLWQEAADGPAVDSPEYRFGERFFKLYNDICNSIGIENDAWESLEPVDQWCTGKAVIALIESLEDVEVHDPIVVTYRGVDTIEPL